MSLSSVTTPPNPNSPAVPVASGHLSSRFLRLSSRGGSVSKLRLLRNSAARILSRTRMTCWPCFVHHLLHKCCVLHVWLSWIYSFVFSFSCMYLSFIYCSLFDKYKINLPLMEKLPLMFSCWKNMMKPEVCVCVCTHVLTCFLHWRNIPAVIFLLHLEMKIECHKTWQALHLI